MTKLREEKKKEAEQTVLLDGIERLITTISGQNTSNMNLYNENMTTLVQSLKDSLTKGEPGGSTVPAAAGASTVPAGCVGPKTTKLTKPAKVSSWTRDLTLETYANSLELGLTYSKTYWSTSSTKI